MMRMRTVEISVGAFMLAGLLALVFLAVKVSGVSLSTGGDTYTLRARFDDVAGLKVRARVSIAGVAEGRVTGISVEPREGILGGKYIGLSPGADEEYLVDGDEIEITQGAIVLENLIGEFIKNMGK